MSRSLETATVGKQELLSAAIVAADQFFIEFELWLSGAQMFPKIQKSAVE